MRRVGCLLGLALLLTLFTCTSPHSPERDTSLNVAYQYGLYDNFESPSLNSTLWSGRADIAYEDGNHVACLAQAGVGEKQIVMSWPQSIPAEQFREWSTRVKVSGHSSARDFVVGFEYCGRDEGLGWCAELGLRIQGQSSWIYASWINPTAGENFYESVDQVVPDRWYTLKICLRPGDDSKVCVEFYLDGRLFASTVTADSCKTLGNQVTHPQRKLLVRNFSEPSKEAVCFFDDVFGIYGDSSARPLAEV